MNTLSSQQKRIAVVSGAMGYVGFAVSKKLAEEGMCVALLYQSSSLEVVAEKVASLSGEGHQAYQCDLVNQEAVEATIRRIEIEMGPICVCVHSAGQKPKRKQLLASSVQDLEEQIDGNVLPSFIFLTACARYLKEHKRGVLIGITTIGVILAEATRSLGAYIPVKYAVQGMLTMLKEELSASGVRVYSIAPGFMAGGMNSDIPEAFIAMAKEKSPTKQLATAEDIADSVTLLCKEGVSLDMFTIPIAPEYKL